MATFQILYQQRGDAHEEAAITAMRRIHAASFRDLTFRMLIVDNALAEPAIHAVAPDVSRIDGDNTFREFSALDKGWRYIEQTTALDDHDVVLVANETFLTDPEAADFFALPRDARDLAMGDALLGHVDGLAERVCVLGVWMRRWVRSNFMLTNARVLRAIVPFAVAEPDARLFADDPRTFFRDRDDLSPNYRAFVKGFLQGQPNIALWRWPSARMIDQGTLPAFRLKARAILSEHALSARAVRNGFVLRDLSQAQFPPKGMRHWIRGVLFRTNAWRLVPRFRARFASRTVPPV